MQHAIVPHLWFDTQAVEAAEFYASVFPESKVSSVSTIRDTPSGDCDIVSFDLLGQRFMAISAGPLFKFNPSVSFIVTRPTEEEVNELWAKLSEGGTALMPLDSYPFSTRYGWLQDRYGLSWQIMLPAADRDPRPPLVPALMFVGDNAGKADEAINFYASVFEDSQRGTTARYGPNQAPNAEDSIMFADFMLRGQWFAAMDSAHPHDFSFNEAVSFMVNCDSQEQIDAYWEKLSAKPESEQCGWLKDKYGLSWQIVPTAMNEMMGRGTDEQKARLTKAFLGMKKFDIAELKRAFAGN